MVNVRAAYNAMLDDTCDIYRPSVSENAYHEKVSTLELLEEDVPCMKAMATGRKVVLPVGIDPSRLRLVYFKHNQDVQERDVLDFGDNRRYVVNFADPTPKSHHKEAMCETILGG